MAKLKLRHFKDHLSLSQNGKRKLAKAPKKAKEQKMNSPHWEKEG